MARHQLSFAPPPSLPIPIGAAAPNPGQVGVVVWSTVAAQNLVWDGVQWAVQGDVEAQLMPFVGHTEVVREGGRVSRVTLWSDATKTRRLSETRITRSANRWPSSLVKERFDTVGDVVQTRSTTFARDAVGRVASVTVERA